jgi:methionyl-tRNA formyltransferase
MVRPATRPWQAARPDVVLSFHFDQIFTLDTLALAPLGGVNIHPSLLPRHRGPIPAFWALQEGPGATGISIHRIAARIDTGDVLAQRAHALPPGSVRFQLPRGCCIRQPCP